MLDSVDNMTQEGKMGCFFPSLSFPSTSQSPHFPPLHVFFFLFSFAVLPFLSRPHPVPSRLCPFFPRLIHIFFPSFPFPSLSLTTHYSSLEYFEQLESESEKSNFPGSRHPTGHLGSSQEYLPFWRKRITTWTSNPRQFMGVRV